MPEQVFVARERELSQLQAFLDRTLTGQGQASSRGSARGICFVTGEAGAGKPVLSLVEVTALVTEFARRAQTQHDDLLVAAGRGDAQTGAGDPYLPFRYWLPNLSFCGRIVH